MKRKVTALPRKVTIEDQEKKKRVAAYCRVSTGSEEQLLSYRTQVDYYEKYIRTNPEFGFVGIYADEGISGTSLEKREAFSRMMEDCKIGKIDMIITKSVSRFGRNTVDCLASIRKLKEYGVNVNFEKESIETMKAEGELLISIMAALSQNESKVQSENVKWGIRRRYEQGNIRSVPSGKFLGYDKDEHGDLIINEEQAKIVKRIYEEFLKGYAYYKVTQRLTEEGIPTERKHTKWSYSVTKKILTNEKYKGDTLFQKTYNTDYLTKRRAKNRGELPQPYFEDTHPAIIDKTLWECVQLEFKRRNRFKDEHYAAYCHGNSERLPMVSKITCKHCGCTFGRRKYKSKKQQHRYYWCCSCIYKKELNLKNDNIHLADERPTQLFVEAWNLLFEKSKEELNLEENTEGNVLDQYRRQQLVLLMKEYGPLEAFDYELMLQTLENIQIAKDGTATAFFSAGIEIQVLI